MVFITLFLLRKTIGEKPEWAFLALAIILGTLLSFSEKKNFNAWDEPIHYERANDISFRSIIKKDVRDIYLRTNSVPSSYSLKEQEIIDNYLDSQKDLTDDKKKKKRDNPIIKFATESYGNLAYLPSAFALAIGRLLHFPFHITFIFGRWINVWVFSLVVFLAIRKLKSGKMIMATVALLPTSLFLASNYHYDSWVIAFSLLGFAYFFSELQQPEKKITRRDAVIMIGALVLACAPKPIYFPLFFLLFLLGPAKFDSARAYKKFILGNVLATLFVAGSFFLPLLISGLGEGDSRGGEAVNATEQVKFILSEPLTYAQILFNFLKFYLNPKNADGFMTLFAYLGHIKGFLIISSVLLFAIFTDKNELDKHTSTLKVRSWVIGILFMTVSLIATALYVDFTAVRSPEIIGVQQRYLIPLLFPLFFVVGSNRIKKPLNRNFYNLAVFSVISVVLLKGIWDILTRLYH